MPGQRAQHLNISGALIDLGGVVYAGDQLVPDADAALARLRAAGIAIRFLTNTTRQPRRAILERLARLGIAVSAEDLLTPAQLAMRYLSEQQLSPHLLIHPNLIEDFAGAPHGGREAVVVGDAGTAFDYQHLNEAYRRLEAGADLIALARNRNFLDRDGALSLDAGPFVAALEYASRRQAMLLGKPSPEFFRLALASLGCDARHAVMIGDDAEADVGGAMAEGLLGFLVETGKYRPGAEAALTTPPTHVAADLGAAVDWLLG